MRWFPLLLCLGTIVFISGAASVYAGVEVNEPARRNGTEQRVALIIGNEAYPSSPLRNPVRDARSVAEELRKLGFQTIVATDSSAKQMFAALRMFEERLTPESLAIFYYAGHGFEVERENYLLSIDADDQAENHLPVVAMKLDEPLKVMDRRGVRVKIAIVDACRVYRTATRSLERGLATATGSVGTYIFYSTAPNRPAKDGEGPHSPFAERLLARLTTPGLHIAEMFDQVRTEVYRETKGAQLPWSQSGLIGRVYLAQANTPGDGGGAKDAASARKEDARPVVTFAEDVVLQPKIMIGEKWKYVVRQSSTAASVGTDFTIEVTNVAKDHYVSAAGVKYSFDLGRMNDVRAGSEVSWYAPAIRGAPFPLKLGQRWRLDSKRTDIRGWYADLQYRGEVEGKEVIEVPAGRFEALRVAVWWTYSNRNRDSGSGRQRAWYVPSLKMWAKVDYEETSDTRPDYRQTWVHELLEAAVK